MTRNVSIALFLVALALTANAVVTVWAVGVLEQGPARNTVILQRLEGNQQLLQQHNLDFAKIEAALAANGALLRALPGLEAAVSRNAGTLLRVARTCGAPR